MKKLTNLAFILLATYFFVGCAHKISIAPKTDEILIIEANNKLNANVGYYISQEDRKKEVITPGGGGDDVKYNPYSDTESAFRLVLTKMFNNVHSLNSLEDDATIKNKNIKYVFVPSLYTTSYSESLFTWPPTKFTFELRYYVLNNKQKEIWSDIIYSEGYATFSEFKSNLGLSAQRATEKVFLKFIEKIDKSNKFDK